MAKIGYAAMLEQFHPTELLTYCQKAEAAGFSGVMAADHVQPWTPDQGQAAFVWSFMAAAAERTKGDVGPARDLSLLSPAPGDHRAGRGHYGCDVSRPLLAGPGLGRGPERAHRGRLLARGRGADQSDVRVDRDHSQTVQRQGRQARGRVLQDGDDAALDDAGQATADLRVRRPGR